MATPDLPPQRARFNFNFRAQLKRQPEPAPEAQSRLRTRRRAISSPGSTVVGALMEQAATCNEPMHAVMSTWVESLGGRYDKGPLKTLDRILEKTYTDYAGDPLCVVDIVRGTAVFITLAQLAFALESLLDRRFVLEKLHATLPTTPTEHFSFLI